MSRIKRENPGSPHKDMMGFLSKSYKEMKASKLHDGSADVIPRFEGLEISEGSMGGGKEEEEDIFFEADGGGGELGGVIDLVSEEEDAFWA